MALRKGTVFCLGITLGLGSWNLFIVNTNVTDAPGVAGPQYPRRSRRLDFRGGNGHSLAAIIDQPEGIVDTPTIVFSHCFTCNKDLKAIVRLSRYLAERGYTVLRYDMTGLGNSAGRFAETNFRTNLADLYAAAKFAADEVGSPQFLIGHSLGGAASLAAAADWPHELQPLRGVATLAAPSDTRHLAELLIRMDSRVQSEGRGEVTIGGRRWETTTQLIEDLRLFDLPSRIARINLPVLLFHSPQDETVGFDHALRILSWIGGERPGSMLTSGHSSTPSTPQTSPTASLVTLPGSDHLLTSDPRDLDYVGNLLATWFWRHGKAS